MMMEEKNFIALDLEMNCSDRSWVPGKIIQVGVAIGSLVSYRHGSIDKYLKRTWYIDPNEDIYPRITELTGITNDDVKTKSVSHQVIYDEIKQLMTDYNIFRSPIVWGVGDLKTMKEEFEKSIGKFEIFNYRDLDVKTIHTFNSIVKGKVSNYSLKTACNYYDLPFEGKPHRAEDDAHNTLNIFFHMFDKNKRIRGTMDQIKKLGDLHGA